MSNQIAAMIDHTILSADATPQKVVQLCDEAREYGFASVCVNPVNVALVAEQLKGSPVKACSVIAFPLGAVTPELKQNEAAAVIRCGAQEVDMVINVGAAKAGNWDLVREDIAAVHSVTKGKALLKVIVECCMLTKEEIRTVCEICRDIGVEFVKTSTGFGGGGATMEDVALMRKTVGPDIGVKASGGIRDAGDACKMVEAGANRIGTSAGIAIAKSL